MAGSQEDFFEFRDAMAGRQLKVEYVNEKIALTVCEEYGNSDLFEMESFVKQIIATDELAFIKRSDSQLTSEWHMLPLAEYYRNVNFFIEMYKEDYCYNPFIELFYENVFKLVGRSYAFCRDASVLATDDKVEAEVFNELISNIRDEAGTLKFKIKVKSRVSNLKRSEKSAIHYIQKLFERFARLMVVRIDFSFSKNNENPISTSDARAHFARFLNNKRSNGIFADLVGYVWKLEDGKVKGPHFHCLFFFDGSKARKDVYVGMQIGKYWKEITNGKGQFFNVNANYRSYVSPMLDVGIGMINYHDLDKRRGLAYIVKYFFKAEQYLSAKSLKKLRTYGHGEVAVRVTSGRPRAKTAI